MKSIKSYAYNNRTINHKPIVTRYANMRNAVFSRIFFICLCFSFLLFIIYANSKNLLNYNNGVDERFIEDTLEATDPNYAESLRNMDSIAGIGIKTTPIIKPPDGQPQEPRNNMKQILLWTPKTSLPFNYLGLQQTSFINNKCKFTNCFVTAYTKFFKGDITKFDAIAFNGRNMRYTKQSELPQKRSPHQKYIFFNVESSTYQPVCNSWYDGFFNWTSTYKLNSDILYSYVYIRDKDGVHVGPRMDMNWVSDMKEIDEDFKEKLKSKTKAAAWFVSHCITRSEREKYVKSLQKALSPYELTVDVYGRCGPLTCHGNMARVCNAMVAKDYYFYLSFENAFAEDYVTEKLLTALQNDAVPIVYGGSNYSRFLPPGSYLDAREMDPESLAATMADIIDTPSKYHEFFRWRQHYSYSESERVEDVCNVCAALNDQSKLEPASYAHFRSWWNPNWEERCQDENWST